MRRPSRLKLVFDVHHQNVENQKRVRGCRLYTHVRFALPIILENVLIDISEHPVRHGLLRTGKTAVVILRSEARGFRAGKQHLLLGKLRSPEPELPDELRNDQMNFYGGNTGNWVNEITPVTLMSSRVPPLQYDTIDIPLSAHGLN